MKRLIILATLFASAALADNRIVVLLIGPPGAGKTTQAHKLSKKYGIPSIAMSDLLKKDAGWGKMGSKKIVKAEIESGELANDETADLLMRKRLLLDDARRGFILDGYPATAGESAIQLHRRYQRQVVSQGVLLLCRIPCVRPTSIRAELRGEICANAICWQPTFSSLVYALYRPVDTSVHRPDSGRVHRDDPR